MITASPSPAGPNAPVAPTRSDRLLAIVWGVSVAVPLGAVVWLLSDPRATIAFTQMIDRKHPLDADLPTLVKSTQILAWIIRIGMVGFVILLLSLFLGPPKHRTLRSWLALTALVALWLGLFASWQEFAWAGQRWRIGRQIEKFEPLAATLRQDWPEADGELTGLGSFSAYPIGRPRTLAVLLPKPLVDGMPIGGVERSNAGGLVFFFRSNENVSLEWHPDGEQPASFTGGLEVPYRLTRSSSLGKGWYVTRYNTPK